MLIARYDEVPFPYVVWGSVLQCRIRFPERSAVASFSAVVGRTFSFAVPWEMGVV